MARHPPLLSPPLVPSKLIQVRIDGKVWKKTQTMLLKIPYVGDLMHSIAQSHLNGVEDILNQTVNRIVRSSEDKSVSCINNDIQNTLNECSKGKHVSPCCTELDPLPSLLIAGNFHLQGMIDTIAIVPPLSDPSTEGTLPHLLVGVLKLDSSLIYINHTIPTDICNAKWIPKSEGLIGSSRSLLSVDSNGTILIL
eukprot:jgi/Psemu1/41525/gm1.41525_g